MTLAISMSSSWDDKSGCTAFLPFFGFASFEILLDRLHSKGSLHATPRPKQQNQMRSYEEPFLVHVTPPTNDLKPCHICNAVE